MTSFDENGKYIKTNWKNGDRITADKLNKIEESIEAVNDNDISRHVETDTRLDALETKVETDLESVNTTLEHNEFKFSKTTSPEIFGAKGDGVNDDTDYIQDAINACENGGEVRLNGNYKVTSTIVMKRGVKLLGTNDGIFTDKSRILVSHSGSAIVFDTVTTGIEIKDLVIQPFDSTFNKKFNGIEFNNSEYTNISNVTIDNAMYGYYFSCKNKSNYLCKLTNISAINCDIGIYIQKASNNSWSNGIYLDLKEVSKNRIGVLAEEGQGNTIVGTSTEIGLNTEVGIKIIGGHYTIKGNLWLEGSPVGIEVGENAVVTIDGELYNIKPIISKGTIIQNSKQVNINHINKKINFNNCKVWISFDSETPYNAVNGEVYDNTYDKLDEGIYGHSSHIKNHFGLNLFKNSLKLDEDWTMMFLLKIVNSNEQEGITFLRFANDDRTETKFFDINNVPSSLESPLYIRSSTGNGNFLLGIENYLKNDYAWVVLQYDSIDKKIKTFNSVGLPTRISSEKDLDLSSFSKSELFYMTGTDKIIFDEIVMYNRKLSQSEIMNICDMKSIPLDLKVNLIINKIGGLI